MKGIVVQTTEANETTMLNVLISKSLRRRLKTTALKHGAQQRFIIEALQEALKERAA